jgi:hypothetical protein
LGHDGAQAYGPDLARGSRPRTREIARDVRHHVFIATSMLPYRAWRRYGYITAASRLSDHDTPGLDVECCGSARLAARLPPRRCNRFERAGSAGCTHSIQSSCIITGRCGRCRRRCGKYHHSAIRRSDPTLGLAKPTGEDDQRQAPHHGGRGL